MGKTLPKRLRKNRKNPDTQPPRNAAFRGIVHKRFICHKKK